MRCDTLAMIGMAAALACVGEVLGVDEYRIDDGVPEQNMGLSGGGNGSREIAWLNRFVIQPGDETITHINVAFGNIPNGNIATAYLWYDTNQDGDPSDAFWLAAQTDLVQNATPVNPAGWMSFDITDTTLIPGDIIYAGVIMEITPNEQPARIDRDGNDQPVITYPPNDHSFIAGDTVNQIQPNAMGLAQLPVVEVATAFGFDGTWLIRLDTLGRPCPADLNGDGVVDSRDLAILLAGWNNGTVDLDGDGVTGAGDLAVLLAAWGPCP